MRIELPPYMTAAWLRYTIYGLRVKAPAVAEEGHISAERHMLNAAEALQSIYEQMGTGVIIE
jgi:hypothetical protein